MPWKYAVVSDNLGYSAMEQTWKKLSSPLLSSDNLGYSAMEQTWKDLPSHNPHIALRVNCIQVCMKSRSWKSVQLSDETRLLAQLALYLLIAYACTTFLLHYQACLHDGKYRRCFFHSYKWCLLPSLNFSECFSMGLPLGAPLMRLYSPILGGGELHRPRFCAVFNCQGKSSVWEGREGCSEQCALVAIWTGAVSDGLNAALLDLVLGSLSRSLRIRGRSHLCII
eukprot:1143399-Pelagomonas_calceolata.AAC.6